MAAPGLKALLRAKSGDGIPVPALMAALQGPLSVEDAAGNRLAGVQPGAGAVRIPVLHNGAELGCVAGPPASAEALSAILAHAAVKESERRALANEVLQLYREVHLIDQLCEDLTALLDVEAAAESALGHAHRMIASESAGILVRRGEGDPLQYVARRGDASALPEPDSPYLSAVVERGVAEIVNAAEIAGPFAAAAGLRSLLFAPLRAKQRTVGAIVLAHDAAHPYTAANMKLLNTIALQTAAAIENSQLCSEMVEAARYREQLTALQRELETARAIQHSLVPRVFPPFPGRDDFDLHAQMVSARAVGGDFFNFFLLDEDRLGLVVGDVSGKGTPSALFMAVTHTHIRTVAPRFDDPAQCLAEVNRILVADKASSMFATCFYGVLNTRTGELRYSSAGHNPPYRFAPGGEVSTLEDAGGPPLGLFPGRYEGTAARLEPGEGLFLYTDGVPEANNPELDDFTDERLVETLRASAALPSRDLIAGMHARLTEFTAGAPQSDDITMLAVRRALG